MAESLLGQYVGQYKVVAELGRGQHTTVYKALQLSLERHVALKVLRRYDQATLQKFQAEARLTAQLIQNGVPNIREVYEVGQTPDGYLFVALQFVDGSLHNLLRRGEKQGRRRLMSPETAGRLLQPVAQALDAIHSLGWVHLDIKPQNILITREGRAMLADFGIAQRRGARTHACTPTYASPEQAAGDRPVGPWSDIYSLGGVLYEMVAGHPPVRGDHDIVLLNQHLDVMPPSPRKVNPHISATQERTIMQALAKSPQQRHRTAGELVQALLSSETFLSSVIQTPASVINTTTSWIRRKPHLLLGGGAVVLVLAVLILVGWALWSNPPGGTPASTSTMVVSATVLPSLTATRQPTATMTSTATQVPTSTLAPFRTATPRPTPRPTRTPTPPSTVSSPGGTG
jgi:serine/threonine protein kinase